MGGFVGTMPAGPLNVALSNFAKEFENNVLVGNRFAPRVPVERQSFQYVVWNRDNWRVPGNTQRAAGDRPITTRRGFSTQPYMAASHALSTDVPREAEAYGLGLGFSTKKQATKQVRDQLQLDREVSIANTLLSTTNFPNGVTLSGGSQWDSYITTPADDTETTVTSHPITVVEGYKAVLRQAGIQDAQMALLLSDPVAQALRTHPDIIEKVKFWNTGVYVSDALLSKAFGVEVIVASAVVLDKGNNASWVWGYDAFLGYASAAPSQMDVSCAKTFAWTGGYDEKGNRIAGAFDGTPGFTEGAGIDDIGVIEFPDPYLDSKKDWISADWYYDIKVTAVETGIPILNAVSSSNFPMGTIPSDLEG